MTTVVVANIVATKNGGVKVYIAHCVWVLELGRGGSSCGRGEDNDP